DADDDAVIRALDRVAQRAAAVGEMLHLLVDGNAVVGVDRGQVGEDVLAEHLQAEARPRGDPLLDDLGPDRVVPAGGDPGVAGAVKTTQGASFSPGTWSEVSPSSIRSGWPWPPKWRTPASFRLSSLSSVKQPMPWASDRRLSRAPSAGMNS